MSIATRSLPSSVCVSHCSFSCLFGLVVPSPVCLSSPLYPAVFFSSLDCSAGNARSLFVSFLFALSTFSQCMFCFRSPVFLLTWSYMRASSLFLPSCLRQSFMSQRSLNPHPVLLLSTSFFLLLVVTHINSSNERILKMCACVLD